MNKKQERQRRLQEHYAVLEVLANSCGVEKADGRKISLKLYKLEQQAHKLAEQYCNADIEESKFDKSKEIIIKEVQNLFAGKLQGFFFNNDPREAALKIKHEIARDVTPYNLLKKDWGGYGMLSPEIN